MSSNTKLVSSNEDQKSVFNVPKVLYENRYCSQDSFSILVCGGVNENRKAVNDVYELQGKQFKSIKFPSMLEPRKECKTAVIGSDIFVVGGYTTTYKKLDPDYLYSIEMFSKKNKTWCYPWRIL